MQGRKKTRITIVGDVVINDSLKTKGLDISEGGMYVFTREPSEKGQHVKVSIPFKDSNLEVTAIVQHVEDGMGMGLRFFNLDEGQHAMIREYIETFSGRSLDMTKKKVLLADSNEMSLRFDRNRLCIEGFDVYSVTNGPDLLDVLGEEEVDIVITDMFLDKMDAFKLLSLKRQTPRWQKIPVLVLTSSNNPEDIDRAAASGAVEIMLKNSTNPLKLTKKIREILNMDET
jgi:CheY-like chemotaxis protein